MKKQVDEMDVDELEVDEMRIRRGGTTPHPYRTFHLIDKGQSNVCSVSFRNFLFLEKLKLVILQVQNNQ